MSNPGAQAHVMLNIPVRFICSTCSRWRSLCLKPVDWETPCLTTRFLSWWSRCSGDYWGKIVQTIIRINIFFYYFFSSNSVFFKAVISLFVAFVYICIVTFAGFHSKTQAAVFRQMINDSLASPAEHYAPSFELQEGAVASQLMIMGTDDLIVSVMRWVTVRECVCAYMSS